MANLEVNIGNIQPGNEITVKWRGKPVFIRHRSAEDIAKAQVRRGRDGERVCWWVGRWGEEGHRVLQLGNSFCYQRPSPAHLWAVPAALRASMPSPGMQPRCAALCMLCRMWTSARCAIRSPTLIACSSPR